MQHLDLTWPSPEENLACEEALLEAAERGDGDTEVLRFWEAPRPVVVIGYGQAPEREVNLEACQALGVPVLRRVSGGGTVVQGPGCLCYALILRLAPPHTATIADTTLHVLERHRAALEALLGRPVAVEGSSDLALGNRKFSGNAQRRARTHLLFHGTFLLHFDLTLLERLTPLPQRQPPYRAQRPHGAFVTNLGRSVPAVKAALRHAWGAHGPAPPVDSDRVAALVRAKYGRREWTFRAPPEGVSPHF